MPRGPRLTEDDIELLRQAHINKTPYKIVAWYLGRTENAVAMACSRMGLVRQVHPTRQRRRLEAAE